MIDWAADSDLTSMTTFCRGMIDWMEDRLGRRLGPDFDDYCFRWMIEWAADSDPTSMTTVFRWMIGWMIGPEFDD